jgi:hypothetical protein
MFTSRGSTIVAVACTVLGTCAAPRAWAANEVTFTFTRPTNTTTTNVELEFERNGTLERVTVPIEPGNGERKRDAIKQALADANFDVAPVGLTGLRIEGVRAGTKVTFKPGNTGEDRDTQTAMGLPGGTVGFANTFFDPVDAVGQPAFFTAGIITDVGELSTRISATEIPGTSGPIICQALFQRLAPQAPAYGAHINYLGESLSITFDPALAQGDVGIVYGTTSLTSGVYGSMQVVPEPATCAVLMLGSAMLVRRRRRCAIRV